MSTDLALAKDWTFPSSHSPSRQRRKRTEPAKAASTFDKPLVNAMAMVVHDLRGPLANLQIMVELIEAHSQRKTCAEIPACASRAIDLIQALDEMLAGFLERARTTGDPLAYRAGLVDLREVTRRAETLSRPLAESSGIVIERRGSVPVVIEGDSRLLIEAIDNILSNAVKHSPKGATIVCASSLEGESAVVRIEDEGPGFSASEVHALFRPFTRLSRKAPAAGPSTGLGLWIARLIATRHGGSLSAANRTDGRGSVFTLRLPARLGPAG